MKKKMIYIFLFSIIISKIFTENKMRWSFELINHGARAPNTLDSNYKDFMNHQWIGQNELTGVGLRQSFLVGFRDRLRYIEDEKLISEEYDPRDILVYGSEYNRTLMSASALLHGLFLPGTGPQIDPSLVERAVPPVDPLTFQEEKEALDNDNYAALPGRMNLVPVHIFFPHEYFTQYENSNQCKGLASYEEENRKRNEVKQFLEEMTEKYGDNLIKIFTDKKRNLLEDYDFAYNFFDTTLCLYFEAADEFNTILQILDKSEEEVLNDCYKFLSLNTVGNGKKNDRDFVNYLVSPLFDKILYFIDYRIEKDMKGEENYKGYDLPKYFILSGITNTCGAFMAFMNKYFDTNINYANFSTNLHLELWRNDTADGKIDESSYRIEYYYNDDFLLSIPYNEFKDKIKPKLINQDKIKRFCTEDNSDDKSINWYMIGIIIASIIILILIVFIVIILKKRSGENNSGSIEDRQKLLRDTNRTTEENNQNNDENS